MEVTQSQGKKAEGKQHPSIPLSASGRQAQGQQTPGSPHLVSCMADYTLKL